MQKWIWYQESLTRKFIIKSFVKDFLLQNIKKWTLQKNKEKYAVIKQSKMMTKMNQKMEKLGEKLLVPFELLHNVILCFWNIVFVFRIYDWKKLSIWLIFYVFLFQTLFSQMLFLARWQKYLRNAVSNQLEIFMHSFPH